METRWKIARLFNISAKGIKEVVDNRVISDGFLHKDLAAITKEKMSEITKVKSDDFYVLFNALAEFVEGRFTPLDEILKEKMKNKEFKKSFDEETEKLNVINANVQQKESKAEVRPAPAKKRGRTAKGRK